MQAGRRYQAPAADRAVLADPPAAALPGLVAAARARLAAAEVRVDGVPLGELRAQARAEVVALAADYLRSRGEPVPDSDPAGPLVLTGHQPELFHPGVWCKNFALNRLARQVGGTPLHLIVDTDTLKSAALKLPAWDGPAPAAVRQEPVAFDRFAAEEPYEGRRVLDPGLFATFAGRAAGVVANWGYRPLVADVWPGVVARPPAVTLAERFTAARRIKEREWGCHNLELPVSVLATTAAFRRFACQVLTDLPRFAASYNAAVRAYRARNRVRSVNHPAPELAADEAPFWRVTPGGRTRPVHPPGTPPDFAGLRPRALTLTLFARLCVGDFFIHGIGGGKYDEVTDAIIADYFGLEPPPYQVLSATAHLPLPRPAGAAADAPSLRRRVRDVRWNPHRHLDPAARADPAVRERVARRESVVAAEPADRAGRRRWFREVRAATDALVPFTTGAAATASEALAAAETRAGVLAGLTRRDASWVLYPDAMLAGVMRGFLAD